MDLNIDVRRRNGLAVVALRGEVDPFTAPKLRDKLLSIIDGGGHDLVIDLDGLELCDANGLGVLIGGLQRVKGRDGSLSLVCSKERILKIFRSTGLSKIFTIYESVAAATGRPEGVGR